MSRFLVVVSAEIEADDAWSAYDLAMSDIRRYPTRVWTVPKNLDDDPSLLEIHPEGREERS